ncbi:MAG: hypothetical protein ABI682_05505 [Acidobacteriota bacterium]
MEDDNRQERSTPAPKPRRRAPAAKKSAPAASAPSPAAVAAVAAVRRKTPSQRKSVAPKKKQAAAVAGGLSLETMLRGFADRATEAGASLAALSGEGVQSARRAIGQAGAVSKSTIDRITREWQRMDGKKRAQFIAALLAALAAASAPIVRSKLKKR